MTHVNQREVNRRAWRAKTWAGVWRANGFSRGTIEALLRAEIDSNRRLLGLTRKGLRDIEGIGDSRVREIERTGSSLRRGRMSRCLRVLGVGFMVLRFTRLGVVLVVTAWQLELRKRAHV